MIRLDRRLRKGKDAQYRPERPFGTVVLFTERCSRARRGSGEAELESIDESRKQRVREEISAAAFVLLCEDADATLTMRALAARLGIQPSNLYLYVRDRDEVMRLIVEHALGDTGRSGGGRATSPREVVHDLLRSVTQDPGLAKALHAAADLAFREIRERVSDTCTDDPFRQPTSRAAIDALAVLLTGTAVWLFGTETTGGSDERVPPTRCGRPSNSSRR